MAPELALDRQSFPPAPPADMDDPLVIVKHDWDAFVSVDRMTNHWDRAGWHQGRRTYYWMLTFPDCPVLNARARSCQDELSHLGMDAVPDDGLHVTMTRVGDSAQVPPADVDRLARLAESLQLESFHMLAHPLAGSRGALRFSLTPWTPLVRLHSALVSIGQRAGVPGGGPTAAFRPHLGVAYNNRIRPARPVIDAVLLLHSLPPVPIEVRAVDLVELRREGTTYRWDILRSLPLRRAGTDTSALL